MNPHDGTQIWVTKRSPVEVRPAFGGNTSPAICIGNSHEPRIMIVLQNDDDLAAVQSAIDRYFGDKFRALRAQLAEAETVQP